MVGIVIVSHSPRIAEGVAELAREMGGDEVALETAGGLDTPDGAIGTDAVLVMQAIERAWSDDGVLVLMDLGSAVLSAEMAIDLLGEDRRERIVLSEAPLVEGAVAAAVTAKLGRPLEVVAREARAGLAGKVAHLGDGGQAGPEEGAGVEALAGTGGPAADVGAGGDGSGEPGEPVVAVLRVDLEHGLHARPAARFVQTASAFDATVAVRNLTTGAGPADAASLNGVATLGVAMGHEVEVRASGPGAIEAIAAVQALAARRFDEPSNGGPTDPAAAPVATSAEGVLTGFPASPGVALGPARRWHAHELEVPESPGSVDPRPELASLEAALDRTAEAIAGQRGDVAARAGEEEARIFDAHALFLRDDALLGPARRAIEHEGRTAARAWRDAVDDVARTWDSLDDEYLRARAVDLRSIGAQVLAHILDVPVPTPRLDASGILVAADLTPADTAGLDPAIALGIVTAHGGPTSHAAVLARALGIPAVVGVGASALTVPEGVRLAVDGGRGHVHVDPPPEVVRRTEEART
ncbi:MAG: dihydroxyacetone kinase phosphoryl donor subunit DhaM, partial [Actinomycetota bacterium]